MSVAQAEAPSNHLTTPYLDGHYVALEFGTWQVTADALSIHLQPVSQADYRAQPDWLKQEATEAVSGGMTESMQKTVNALSQGLFDIKRRTDRGREFRFPTIEGLNTFIEKRLPGRLDNGLRFVEAPTAPGQDSEEIPVEEYLSAIADGFVPVGRTLSMYYHDVVTHGLGTMLMPRAEVEVFKRLADDSRQLTALDHPQSYAYAKILGQEFDISTAWSGQLMYGNNSLPMLNRIIDQLDDRYPEPQERVRKILEATGLLPADTGERTTTGALLPINWETQYVVPYYRRLRTLCDRGEVELPLLELPVDTKANRRPRSFHLDSLQLVKL